ncbi:Fork head protein-like protein 2 [Diplodia seriata]|uniref:Fork head protein-like protein 2 n=1 Tax=Diplodia seriata TaxID=420778 RepID=A0A1S8BHS7_9PEZI|nr:Fork head protein-like protein 2 [Diplodia seriata]
MPPRGGRGGRGAKREVVQEPSDTPAAIETPTRKKRRVSSPVRRQPHPQPQAVTASQLNNTDAAEPPVPTRPPSAQSDRTIGSDDEDDNKEKPTPEELLTQVVPLLRVANYVTNAQVELSNELQKRDPAIAEKGSTQAYAKIEGHHWVFFAKSTHVVIGRGEHGYSARQANENGGTPTQQTDQFYSSQTPTASEKVHIDLGPDKQVSRIHAWIDYEPDANSWFVLVNGRNGLKLDDRTLTRGEKVKLHSGSVIGVCGTEMIFVCPGESIDVHPSIIARARQGESGEGEDGQDESSFHQMNNGHGKTAGSQGGLAPTSAPYNGSTARQHGQYNQSHSYQAHPSSSGPLAPNTPIPSRTKQSPRIKTSPSGAYSRGVMLESTEHIDYSADSAKDLKPPHSYAQLIGQAIMSSPEEQLTLANIYEYIKKHYAFYRHSGGGWQNSIRHNLSLSKHFEKVARRTDEPGKGMKWRLVPEERENFLKKGIHSRKTRMGSSGPNSPAIAQASERLHGAVTVIPEVQTPSQPSKFRVKESPRSVTPPLASYPTANESYTPDRGPQTQRKSQLNSDQIFTPMNDRKAVFTSMPATTFGRALEQESHVRSSGAIIDSKTEPGPTPRPRSSLDLSYSPPPTNGYKTAGLDLPETFNGLVTPLVAKNKPHLAPPSTAKMPSQYCYLSSPAPFWKFADLGSTPARPYVDFSPSKESRPFRFGNNEVEKDEEDEEEDEEEMEEEEEEEEEVEAGPVQPSSPPVVMGDTASRSRDGSNSGEGDDLSPATPTRPSSRRFNTAEEVAVKKQLPTQLEGDEKDEEGIDLMR